MKEMNEKIVKLNDLLSGLGSIVVAFSGGVDSTFWLRQPNVP